MFNTLKKWLRISGHVHIRREQVHTLRDFVSLADRFLDDKLQFDLEWDDFVSWENSDLQVESVRARVAALEPLFFSTREEERRRAAESLTLERNRAAGLLGLPAREVPP